MFSPMQRMACHTCKLAPAPESMRGLPFRILNINIVTCYHDRLNDIQLSQRELTSLSVLDAGWAL